MRWKFVLPAFVALICTHFVSAQPAKKASPAAFMPANALAYAEVREIGPLAKEIAALFQDSVLSNVPDSLDKIRAKYDKGLPPRDREQLGILGLMLAPEIVAELGRVEGAAIAFTGMSPEQEPEFIAVVLPGQSNVPAFFLRTLMTMAPTQKLESVEGVSLHGMVVLRLRRDEKSGEQALHREIGPVFAMTPGALFVGTHTHVRDAILRLKGKLISASLAQDPMFQEARKQMEDKPGIFAFANPVGLTQLLEKQILRDRLNAEGMRFVAALKKTINPKAFRGLAMSLTLEQGSLAVRELVLLDPKEKSQWLDLLPVKAVDPQLFHFAPKDAIWAAAIDNSAGEERFRKFVTLADALSPDGFKFSDVIKKAEAVLEVDLGKDIFGQIASAGIAIGDPLRSKIKTVEEVGPKFRRTLEVTNEFPVLFFVQATSEKAAEDLMNLVPKIIAGGRKLQKPTKQVIQGREIFVLKNGFQGFDEICYGRQGATLVLGPFGGPVADSLEAGAKRQGLLANPQVAGRLSEIKDRQAVIFKKPAAIITAYLSSYAASSGSGSKIGGKDNEPMKVERKVTYKSPSDDPELKRLSEILNMEEYLVLGLAHTKEKLQIDGRIGGLRPLISRLTDFAIEAIYRQHAEPKKKGKRAIEK